MQIVVGIPTNVEERYEGTFVVGQPQLPAVGESWVFQNAIYRVLVSPPDTNTSPPASIAAGQIYWQVEMVASAGLTAAGARLAVINRVATQPTSTVTFTSESTRDYGTAHNGTFTVDFTDCVPGTWASFCLDAAASAPNYGPIPAGKRFFQSGAAYAPGYAYRYFIAVFSDFIHAFSNRI